MGFLRPTKALLKSTFPRGAHTYGKVKDATRDIFLRGRDAEAVFSKIYERNLWNDPESRSGRGSTLQRTTVIRSVLSALLRDVAAESLLDAPCGDFNWMRYVELGPVKYIGADIVPSLIARNEQRYGCDRREFVGYGYHKKCYSDGRCDSLPRLFRSSLIPKCPFCGG